MSPKQYLLQTLQDLTLQLPVKFDDNEKLVEFIVKSLLSKKFRKYSAKPDLIEHIKKAVKINVDKHEPIRITFLQGAYKLWRLEEAPEADWAELFALMYYTNWLKDICAVYKPGVWFDFFVDDLIIPKLDNIRLEDVDAYITSFQNIINFLKNYQPSNLHMTITKVGDQFDSPEAFDKSLQKNIEKVSQTKPVFSERQLAMVELNAKPNDEQLQDPHWREKIRLIHDAYMITKREPSYHFKPDKILVFTQPLPSGVVLALGTTKTSVAKHWVGVGMLKKEGNTYREYILSPKQIETANCKTIKINVQGLNGKNYKTIRIVR